MRTSARAIVALLLAVGVASLFPYGSLAAVDLSQEQTGTLTGSGLITVNGNPTRTGATILSGNSVATGSDGNAIIDVGPIGRVSLRPNSAIVITYSAAQLQLTVTCGSSRLSVTQGQAEVRHPGGTKTLVEGQSERFSGNYDVVAPPGAHLVVDCGEERPAGGFISAGLLGFLALIGVAGGIVAGVLAGGDKAPSGAPPTVSPVQP